MLRKTSAALPLKILIPSPNPSKSSCSYRIIRTFRMACHFEEERFSLGEKSERMVTVTPFMGKLKVYIRQFYVNGNGEIKPGKSGIVLEIKEFEKLIELIPQIKKSIESYELKDTVIPSSPFQLDLPVLDLDTVFLPSPPSQEPISIT